MHIIYLQQILQISLDYIIVLHQVVHLINRNKAYILMIYII